MSADDAINPLFLQLVISLQSAAWFQMGKTVSPVTGKMERDLNQARISIDLLTMIQEKTKGNLTDEEKRLLDTTVYNLQMNYVDELEADQADAKKGKPEAETTTASSETRDTQKAKKTDPDTDSPSRPPGAENKE